MFKINVLMIAYASFYLLNVLGFTAPVLVPRQYIGTQKNNRGRKERKERKGPKQNKNHSKLEKKKNSTANITNSELNSSINSVIDGSDNSSISPSDNAVGNDNLFMENFQKYRDQLFSIIPKVMKNSGFPKPVNNNVEKEYSSSYPSKSQTNAEDLPNALKEYNGSTENSQDNGNPFVSNVQRFSKELKSILPGKLKNKFD